MTNQKPDPIPVLSIVHDAVVIPWHKRETMFWALLGTSLVLIGSHLIEPLMLQEPGWTSHLLSFVVFELAFAVFAITCHRLILLGDGSVPRYGLTKWSSRETRFVGWTLLIYLCAYIALVLLNILAFQLIQTPRPSWLMSASATVAIIALPGYLLARLSVLLPTTAVDERPRFAWAWKMTKGNGWRLFLIVAVIPLAVGFDLFPLLGRSMIMDLLVWSAGCVLYVVEIAALSLSYKHLAERGATLATP
jgi:hypothetical protein